MKRWPLFLIAAPAAVAVWSGWVGLGGLCGFGVIHPLPGIWDRLRLNTAITLPIGVEAYGAYALGAWLPLGGGRRRGVFAKRSAIGSLAVGMLGQVAYHLLAAAHATRAPWPVAVLVGCMPVVTLGFGAALTHLLRAPGTEPESTPTVTAPGVHPASAPGLNGQAHPQLAASAAVQIRPDRTRTAPVSDTDAEMHYYSSSRKGVPQASAASGRTCTLARIVPSRSGSTWTHSPALTNSYRPVHSPSEGAPGDDVTGGCGCAQRVVVSITLRSFWACSARRLSWKHRACSADMRT